MRAGLLRGRVDILENVVTRTTAGAKQSEWTVIAANVPCTITPVNGRKFSSDDQVNNEDRIEVSMRFRTDIKVTHRVRNGADVYEVAQPPINIKSRDRETKLVCKRVF